MKIQVIVSFLVFSSIFLILDEYDERIGNSFYSSFVFNFYSVEKRQGKPRKDPSYGSY